MFYITTIYLLWFERIRYVKAIFTGRNRLKEKENVCCELFTWIDVYSQKCKLDICWHFTISINYKMKITFSWKSFSIKSMKCFSNIKKESRNLQFSFLYTFVCKPVQQVRGKISKYYFYYLICSEKLKKDLSLLSEPTLQPWPATSFARYLLLFD